MDPQNLPQPSVQTIQPVQQTEQITPSKSSFPWKKIISLLLVFVIFLVGGGYYYQTQKKSEERLPPALRGCHYEVRPATCPMVLGADCKSTFVLICPTSPPVPTIAPTIISTANWKPYTNTVYPYSIKYPEEWILKETDGVIALYPPGAELFGETQKNTPGEGAWPGIYIDVFNKQFLTTESSSRSAGKPIDMVVDNVKGDYYTDLAAPITLINFDLPIKNKFDITHFNNGSKTIRFSFPKNFENFETFNPKHLQNVAKFDEETFKAIISTFKFTAQDPTPTINPRVAAPGGQCGTITGIVCSTGYFCNYEGNYPDAAGTCIK